MNPLFETRICALAHWSKWSNWSTACASWRHAMRSTAFLPLTSRNARLVTFSWFWLQRKWAGWLPRILTFLTSSPAVAACFIGTEHPLFWRHKQLPQRRGKSGSDFYQSTIYISHITKRVWTNFQIVSNLVLHTAIKAWLFGLGAIKAWKWVFLSQSFNRKLLCEQCKFHFPTQSCIWLFQRNCNYDITPLTLLIIGNVFSNYMQASQTRLTF